MNISEKLVAIYENTPKIYEAGEKAGARKCAMKHYTELKRGDGTNVFSVSCGFEPDYFVIFSYAGYALIQANTIQYLANDRRSMGQYAAVRVATNENAVQSNARISNKAAAEQFTYADGVMKYDGSASSVAAELVFDGDTYYTAVCVKYTDESDAEIIKREVDSLPASGGTVTFSQLKVNGAFTDDEWESLIETKTNWNISFV